MSKIYLEDALIWSKDRLPNESEAMRLLGYHVSGEINPEAAIALSSGIDVIVNGNLFEVELSSDERINYGQKG